MLSFINDGCMQAIVEFHRKTSWEVNASIDLDLTSVGLRLDSIT